MEKRVLLAVVLSFIVLFGYQALFPPPPPPGVESPPAVTPAPAAPATDLEPPRAAADPPRAAADPARPVIDAEPLVAAAEDQEIVIESDAVHAVFGTRGAVLKSWRLKHYLDAEGEPLELVPQDVPDAVRPFTLTAPDPAVSAVLRNALFKPGEGRIDVGDTPVTLAFEYRDASGLAARKQFDLDPALPYVIRFTADVTRNTEPVTTTVDWGPALGTGIISGGMMYSPAPQPIFYRDGDVTRMSIDDARAQSVHTGGFGFVGVDDHYFLSAALPDQPLRVEYHPLQLPIEGHDRGRQFVSWSLQYPGPPQNAPFFLGPKDFDVLAAVDRDLVRAIHFGIFSWFVVPLLRALKWINAYLGNYGWSIIALTVLINLVIFPLRHKSVVSMRRMQELQPEVKAIQERYSKLKMSDPARGKMNAELMNLYRERGVNPASGCVPMLLTLPVLFSFYSMLSVAIELRGAPFILWIRDLSTHDPYFVTPILMGATMVLQQKMMPSTADPMQQKMMMFMPIVFTFMFIWMPAGLVLYWTASNIWAIGQQAVTNRLIGPPAKHTVRPPAERRVKSAGAGKSQQAAKERK